MRVCFAVVTGLLLVPGVLILQGTGHATELEPTPVWQNQTLMGPARAAADLLPAKLSYNAETKKLTFRLGLKRVEMTLGSKSAKINGKTKTLPEAPKVINGTSYVPLKNLFVGLGWDVKPGGDNAWILCSDKLCKHLEVPPKPE